MAASRYVGEPAPFLNEIMFDAVLPRLNDEADQIVGRARGIAASKFGVDADGDGISYADSIGTEVERIVLGGGPRSSVNVIAAVPYANKIEQRHAIMSRAAGSTIRGV